MSDLPTSLAIALWAAALGASGCVGREGPVTRSVATCRELSQRGITAFEQGELEQAEALLAQAVEACPADIEARQHYAEALWRSGAMPEAIVQLEEAIRLSSSDARLLVRAGEMYLDLGRNDQAWRRAQLALDLDPRFASAWALRGAAARAEGHPDQALADLHQALSNGGDDPVLLLEAAEIYGQLGRPAQALAAVQTLKDIYHAGEEPQRVLYAEGVALAALGRHANAAESFAASLRRGPPSPDMLYRLGESQWLSGYPAEAQQALEQALALAPAHQPSLELAQLMARQLASGPSAPLR